MEAKKISKQGINIENSLNFSNQFRLNHMLEGRYLLMFFQDINDDNKISSGNLNPYRPSEWFYSYPDTINIRANWDIELNDIKLGKNY